MSNFQNVLQVCLIAAWPRLGERHIANTPGDLGQVLAGNLGVGLPGNAVILKKAFQLGVSDGLPAHQIDGRLTNYPNPLPRIDGGGHERSFL